MLTRFFRWLLSLPAIIKTWPGRLLRWSVRLFRAFVRWVRDFPRQIKEGVVALGVWIAAVGLASWQWARERFERATARLTKTFKKAFDPDPSKIDPRRLTVPKRGRTVAIFSRQLASMTQGGVPLLQSLDVLSDQADDLRMGYVSRQLAASLSQGFSLSKATAEFPMVFPPVFSHLLKAGEGTGRIVEVITRLADLLEKEENMIKQVRGALSYPIFVMGLTSVLTLGLFSTVLPGFADFYKDFKVPLPVITAFLMQVTAWVQTPWFWLTSILGLIGIYQFTKSSWQKIERRLIMYRFLLGIPLMGSIIRYSTLARFCWVLELTQDAGLDLIRSIKLACLGSGSTVLEVDSKRLSRGITEGEYLSDLMKQRPDIHPHLLQQMVMMGEETSQYSQAFGRSAAWYEQEVQSRIDTFQAALEPILMGLISMVVGTIVLAVFLPLYGLLDKLGV